MSELVLTLRQSAQVGDKARSDFVLSTHDFLPGTVVRGAFAAAWVAAHGPPAAASPSRRQFLDLFEGGVRYGPLFAGGEFTPLSVASHKYQPEERCAIAEYDAAAGDGVPARCPDCDSPLQHPKGLRGAPVEVRRRTSVAIATSGVARSGQLVTRDTLQAGQSFRGTLVASDPGLLEMLAALGGVRVGGRRTTHGAAQVRIQDGTPPTAQRRADGLLVIRLRSAGVFVDDYGRPSRAPNPRELADVLGGPARVIRSWTRWDTAGGWHIASGLPKPVELAVAAGSTYLVEPSHEVTDEALAALGRRGLGLRRHEGFGDLAPPPVLAPGRSERDAERRRRRGLLDSAAPLRALAVTQPGIWGPLAGRLAAHAAGDQAATQFLRNLAGQLDQHTARALIICLSMSPADAGYVVEELSTS